MRTYCRQKYWYRGVIVKVEARFDKRRGFIVVSHSGVYKTFMQDGQLTSVLENLKEGRHCSKLLFDGRDMVIDCQLSKIFFSGEHFDRVGINHNFKIAILYNEYEDKIKFLELVVQNRGHNMRAFKNEKEAIDWLTGATKPAETPGMEAFPPLSPHTAVT
jgi:hypothetical protein